MSESRIPGFFKLTLTERIERLAGAGWLSEADAARLRQGRYVLPVAAAERMVENTVGVFGLPLACLLYTSDAADED